MIKRLRPKYSDDELKEIYATPHDHSIFPDHIIRFDATFELGQRLLDETTDKSGADLSCGNGQFLQSLPLVVRYFGDYAPNYQYCGPIERTIGEIPNVDVFVFCETLEHVDDPLMVLKLIRAKTNKLILSTPLGEHTDENPEHYWGWDREGVGGLLSESGFSCQEYTETNPPMGYRFQIWGCT